MARTPSTMALDIGTVAPDFTLPDYSSQERAGRLVSLAEAAQGRPLVVMFLCNHCPFVKHVRAEIANLARKLEGRVSFVAINPNDVTNYPDDRPEKMIEEAASAGYTFPYLYDESQAVAKAYHAACTPDFYLLDTDGRLRYRGQLDDSRPGNGLPVTGKDLRIAIDAVLQNEDPPLPQFPSLGCNIKWKAGNEPEYYLNP
ncbi:MAG TPA: thioredoxin family protein [Phycisphaerales bacterium]|nr:thioredoxin family protein [Phycisphaerales bacterium]